jgi:hypothetical protein
MSYSYLLLCQAVPWFRRLVACLSQRRPGFSPGSVHFGFAVDKVALGQVQISEFFGFPCHYHLTVALHTHITWGMNRPVGGCSSDT